MPRVAGVKRSIDLAMVEIGRFNTLTVVKIVDFGVYLDGGERGEGTLTAAHTVTNLTACTGRRTVERFYGSGKDVYKRQLPCC